MTNETLLEKAHRLVDTMDETRLENFVIRYDDTVSVKKTHPLFQLAGILSHEEAQEIRSEQGGEQGEPTERKRRCGGCQS